jgi:phosphoribosyl-dephospho-CoA transferase
VKITWTVTMVEPGTYRLRASTQRILTWCISNMLTSAAQTRIGPLLLQCVDHDSTREYLFSVTIRGMVKNC